MAKQNDIVWKKAEETVEMEDTGDILTPLRRIERQYLARAARHVVAGKPERAEYYDEQANNIARMINA
jgi:non-ribosomal peptide synthetase component F